MGYTDTVDPHAPEANQSAAATFNTGYLAGARSKGPLYGAYALSIR